VINAQKSEFQEKNEGKSNENRRFQRENHEQQLKLLENNKSFSRKLEELKYLGYKFLNREIEDLQVNRKNLKGNIRNEIKNVESKYRLRFFKD